MDSTTQNGNTGFGPSETVEALQHNTARLEAELEMARTQHSERVRQLKEEHESYVTRLRDQATQRFDNMSRTLNKTQRRLDNDRDELRNALQELHGDKEPFTIDSPEVQEILAKAFRITTLIGFTSEAREIAYHLDCQELFARVSDEQQPETDEAKNSLMDSVEKMRHQVHPLDPRFTPVWKKAFQAAQNAGMCTEFETIAERVGIPTNFEFDYSGYIEIEVRGTISHYVEGRATREALRNGDIHFLDDFDLSNYIHDLDWEIDSEDINFETNDN